MAAVRNSDEKEVESVEDYTQELSGSHTSSPPSTTTTTNDNSSSSVGRQQCQSLDTHQSLLNGSQPNPFVCDGVLVAPHTDDSLPSGALVNGSASHCTSEEPRVPNKDASPLPRTDTNPQVLEPPSELQSNTWRKPEGHILEASSARTLYESDSSDCDAPLAWDNADNGPISRLQASNGFEAGSLWDGDCDSDSSSENYEGLNKNLREKFMCLLLKGGILDGVVKRKMEVEGLQPNSLSRRKQKLCEVKRIPIDCEVNDGFGSNTDSDCDSSVTKDPSLRKEPESLKAYMESSLRNYCSKKSLISSDKVGGQDEAEDYVGGKPEPLKKRLEMGSESELSFFQCTKCNANFKEKKQLQRHMMYHLDQHNQGRQESVLHPFICKECGRSFRESSSLQKHMLIHQLRQERLMKEIKGLNEMRNKGSQCTIRTEGCQTLSRHAKTHEKDKPYSSCEESNHVALRKDDVEAHQCTTPLEACQDGFLKTFGVYFCKLCTFTSRSTNVFREHLEIHSEAFSDNELDSVDTRSVLNQNGLVDQTKAEDSSPALPKPPPFGFRENHNRKSGTDSSVPSSCLDDLYPKGNSAQKSYQESSSSLFKRRFGSLANNLSASSLQCDKPSKSSLPTEGTDVTAGFWNVAEDNQKCEKTNSLSSFDVHPATEFATSSKVPRLNDDSDIPTKDPSASDLVVPTPRRKSPSKRKMSTPYRNAPKTTALILPKRELESLEEMSWQDHYTFQDAHHESTGDAIVLNGEDESSPCTTDHYIPQELHIKEEDAHDFADFDGHVEDSSEITTLIVKEENIESALSDDNEEYQLSDSYASYRLSPMFEAERKCCPYCPAVFDSGVGLSNHIRGHLHRLGLRYEARHMLSPEQVASQDWQPRIRRRVHAISKSIRRAEKPDSQTEYTCPLCMGWFDTKTGLSNHVRGHLKRIGMPITGLSKSPLSILTELLQDEHEHGNILRALKVKPSLSKSLVCRKFAGSKDLLLSPTAIPDEIQHSTNGLPSEEEEKRKSRETVNRIRETSSSALVELLKKERLDLEQEDTGRPQTGRARFMVPPSRRVSTGGQYKELNSICNQEKNEPNKRICIHCNATFHSGVSLSNHLRAYERRKRIALQEGLSYDCSPVSTRSRSGPKMKPLQTARTTSEVIYSLSCRFCDLVFEGPQCVQEDWVKHLQRHLMHTTVSGSGAPMVEIPTVAAVCDRSCGLDHATQGL